MALAVVTRALPSPKGSASARTTLPKMHQGLPVAYWPSQTGPLLALQALDYISQNAYRISHWPARGTWACADVPTGSRGGPREGGAAIVALSWGSEEARRCQALGKWGPWTGGTGRRGGGARTRVLRQSEPAECVSLTMGRLSPFPHLAELTRSQVIAGSGRDTGALVRLFLCEPDTQVSGLSLPSGSRGMVPPVTRPSCTPIGYGDCHSFPRNGKHIWF